MNGGWKKVREREGAVRQAVWNSRWRRGRCEISSGRVLPQGCAPVRDSANSYPNEMVSFLSPRFRLRPRSLPLQDPAPFRFIAVERHVIGTPTRVGLDGGWVTILLQDLRMPARAVGSLGVDSHLPLVWHVCAAATGAAPGWRPHQAPADGRSDPSVCILYSCSSAACSLRGKERSRRRIE